MTRNSRSSEESAQQQSIADIVKSSPTSKLIGRLNLMRGGTTDSVSAATAPEVADEKWDWMTGLPTSVRFLAKSWKPIKRGPGGIVTDPPDSSKARTSIADQDQGQEIVGYYRQRQPRKSQVHSNERSLITFSKLAGTDSTEIVIFETTFSMVYKGCYYFED